MTINNYPDHAITEWKINTRYDELNNYIYGLYQKSNNKMISFNNMKKISKKISKSYKDLPIGFFGSYIISWCVLEKYEDNDYKMIECDTKIKNFNYIKKTLTERLIIESIKFNEINNVNSKWNKVRNDSLISSKRIEIEKFPKIEVYEKFKLSCKINKDNEIFIGFYLSYILISKQGLNEKDYQNNKEIKLVNILDFSKVIFNRIPNVKLNEKIIGNDDEEKVSVEEYLGKNIIDKYNIKYDTKIISVNYNNNFVISKKEYFIPIELLKLDYNSYRNNNLFKSELKKNTDDKIIRSYEYMKSILINMNKVPIIGRYYDFNNDGIDMTRHGFKFKLLNKPIINKNINLINERDEKGNKEYLKISKWKTNYLNPIFILYKCKNYNEKNINDFIENIHSQSKFKKVTMHFKEFNGKKYIEKNYIDKNFIESIKNSLVFVLIESDYEYDYLKKEFAEYNIPNQIIRKKTLEINNTSDKIRKLSTNILFSILFKCGIYLKKINNDMRYKCFVGIDVSHYMEIKNNFKTFSHSISCTIIIFDGNNNMYITEIGEKVYQNLQKKYIEKIYPKTIKSIFNNIISEYKDICKIKPNNIIIHRDGFCRTEEFNAIDEVLNEENVKYSLVEIFKKINRNIGKYNGKNYNSVIGTYVKSDYNEAYIISSQPYGNEASAFKIKLKYDNFKNDLHEIINEIYYLTFLAFHFDSNDKFKIRLPITIYYSDKCSTSHSKSHLNYGIHYRILNP